MHCVNGGFNITKTLVNKGVWRIKIKCYVISIYKSLTWPPGKAKDLHARILTTFQARSVYPISCRLRHVSVNICLHFRYQSHHVHSVHITQYFTFDLPHSKEKLQDLCVLFTKNYLGDQIKNNEKSGACCKHGGEGYAGLVGNTD